MKRIEHDEHQCALLHICCACNTLVPYSRAEELAPESVGANWPLHLACIESERRWSRRAHAYWSRQDTEAAAR